MAGTGTAHLRDGQNPLLRVEDLTVEFPAGRGRKVHAVSGISFDLRRGRDPRTGRRVGLREVDHRSGGHAAAPDRRQGRCRFDGAELTTCATRTLRRTRRRMQMIFQDPISSLNPRQRVRQIVAEGLEIWPDLAPGRSGRSGQEMLEAVGLDPRRGADRRPHEFSGGQCQRVCIARALVLDPKVVICDEPVSALDVSVQAQILNLLEDMKARYGLTMIFIAHDLAVVKNVSDRVIVMYLGKICEVARPETPVPPSPPTPTPGSCSSRSPNRIRLRAGRPTTAIDELPSPLDPPSGCRFRTRCPNAQERCDGGGATDPRGRSGPLRRLPFPGSDVTGGRSVVSSDHRHQGCCCSSRCCSSSVSAPSSWSTWCRATSASRCSGRTPAPQDYARVKHQLGFDKPVLDRYGSWLNQVVHGNLGRNLVPPIEKGQHPVWPGPFPSTSSWPSSP